MSGDDHPSFTIRRSAMIVLFLFGAVLLGAEPGLAAAPGADPPEAVVQAPPPTAPTPQPAPEPEHDDLAVEEPCWKSDTCQPPTDTPTETDPPDTPTGTDFPGTEPPEPDPPEPDPTGTPTAPPDGSASQPSSVTPAPAPGPAVGPDGVADVTERSTEGGGVTTSTESARAEQDGSGPGGLPSWLGAAAMGFAVVAVGVLLLTALVVHRLLAWSERRDGWPR